MTEQILNNEKTPALPVWARIPLVIFAYIISMGIFQILGALASGISLKDMDALKNPSLFQNMIMYFFSFLAMILCVFLFRKYIDRKSIQSMGLSLKNRMLDLLVGFLAAVALIGGGFLLLYVTGHVAIVSSQFTGTSLVYSFLMLLFVSLNEEIMTRGYILNNLMTKMNKYWALLISALIFALFHGLNPNLSTVGIINLVLAGIVLGASYIFTKNLWFPISLHLFWNFFQGPILGFQMSGQEIESLVTIKTMGNSLIHGGDFGYEGSIVCSIMIVLTTVLILSYYLKKSSKQKLLVAREALK